MSQSGNAWGQNLLPHCSTRTGSLTAHCLMSSWDAALSQVAGWGTKEMSLGWDVRVATAFHRNCLGPMGVPGRWGLQWGQIQDEPAQILHKAKGTRSEKTRWLLLFLRLKEAWWGKRRRAKVTEASFPLNPKCVGGYTRSPSSCQVLLMLKTLHWLCLVLIRALKHYPPIADGELRPKELLA